MNDEQKMILLATFLSVLGTAIIMFIYYLYKHRGKNKLSTDEQDIEDYKNSVYMNPTEEDEYNRKHNKINRSVISNIPMREIPIISAEVVRDNTTKYELNVKEIAWKRIQEKITTEAYNNKGSVTITSDIYGSIPYVELMTVLEQNHYVIRSVTSYKFKTKDYELGYPMQIYWKGKLYKGR